MASQKDIKLYQGHATPKDIILRALPIVTITATTIYLYEGHATPKDIILRDPLTRDAPDIPPPAGSLFNRMMMGLGI